jgi:hypothetical protein
MVTDQEKQKEAYDLHLAAHPALFLLLWEIQNSNTIKLKLNPNTQIPKNPKYQFPKESPYFDSKKFLTHSY